MSQQAKLVERLKRKPKDFEWSELVRLLAGFGYEQENNNGSQRKFYNEATGALICIHEPHPRNTLLAYQVKYVLGHLKEWGVL